MSNARIIGVAAAVALLIIGGLLLAGAGPITYSRGGIYAPCDDLTSIREVEDAMAANADLVQRIRNAGSSVEVEVRTPCEDDPDRALMVITYRSDDERERVLKIVPDDNFGVWLQFEKEPGWLDRLLDRVPG